MIIRLPLAEATALRNNEFPKCCAIVGPQGQPMGVVLLTSPGRGINLATGEPVENVPDEVLAPCSVTLDSVSVIPPVPAQPTIIPAITIPK